VKNAILLRLAFRLVLTTVCYLDEVKLTGAAMAWR